MENLVFSPVAVLFKLFKDFHGIVFVIFLIKLEIIVNLEDLWASTMQNNRCFFRCFGLLVVPLASILTSN